MVSAKNIDDFVGCSFAGLMGCDSRLESGGREVLVEDLNTYGKGFAVVGFTFSSLTGDAVTAVVAVLRIFSASHICMTFELSWRNVKVCGFIATPCKFVVETFSKKHGMETTGFWRCGFNVSSGWVIGGVSVVFSAIDFPFVGLAERRFTTSGDWVVEDFVPKTDADGCSAMAVASCGFTVASDRCSTLGGSS